MNKALFLDRDGTIIKNIPYMSRAEDIVFIPGAIEALKKAKKSGFKLILVTNQSGIGRGLITPEQLEKIHQRLHQELSKEGAQLDTYSFCPHHPDENCLCRKPMPGIIQKTSEELGIDLSKSFMIGDRLCDVLVGRNAGCKGSILLLSADGKKDSETKEIREKPPTYIADDLKDAVDWILENTSGM